MSQVPGVTNRRALQSQGLRRKRCGRIVADEPLIVDLLTDTLARGG